MTDFDTKAFRNTLGLFATGVTVVSFIHEGEPAGMTVNSFASVSLDPPLVLFCPNLSCRFSQDLTVGKLFTVSILNSQQKDVCLHFAGRPNLAQEPWCSQTGEQPPRVEDCLGWLACRVSAIHPHGDHFVVVAEVDDFEGEAQNDPLLFFSGDYPRLSAKQTLPD